MLVLIGDKWLARNDHNGKNRLFDPRDYVRLEIEAALRRGIPVVPVLVEDAEMPAAEELPESIQDLGYRNAAEVRAGRDFYPHMTRLVDGLSEMFESKPERPPAQTVPEKKEPRWPIEQQSPPPKTVAKKEESQRPLDEPKKHRQRAQPVAAAPSPQPASKGHRVLDIATIRKTVGALGSTYVGSAIPAGKLKAALWSYPPAADDVLLLPDGTVFGGAKDGFLITKSAIYRRNPGEEPERLDFRAL